MRCRACNKRMNTHEMLARNPITKNHEELCRTCINAVHSGGWEFPVELHYLKRNPDPRGLFVPLSDEDLDN